MYKIRVHRNFDSQGKISSIVVSIDDWDAFFLLRKDGKLSKEYSHRWGSRIPNELIPSLIYKIAVRVAAAVFEKEAREEEAGDEI